MTISTFDWPVFTISLKAGPSQVRFAGPTGCGAAQPGIDPLLAIASHAAVGFPNSSATLR